MRMTTDGGETIKVLLTVWGTVPQNGKKYLAGISADGREHATSSLVGDRMERDPSGLGLARTKSGSIYALLKEGRDDTIAGEIFARIDPTAGSGGLMAQIKKTIAEGGEGNWDD